MTEQNNNRVFFKSILSARPPVSFRIFLWKHGTEQEQTLQATWTTLCALAVLFNWTNSKLELILTSLRH